MSAPWASRVLVNGDCACRAVFASAGVPENAFGVHGPDDTDATYSIASCVHNRQWFSVRIEGPSGDPVGVVVSGQNFALQVLLERAPQGEALNLTLLHQAVLHPDAWSTPPEPQSGTAGACPVWAGLDPLDYLVSWAAAGYRWADAAPLAAAGIDPPNLYLWAREDFTFDEVKAWALGVSDPQAAAAYREAGFRPEVAAGWFADPASRHLVPETAAILAEQGWTPELGAQGYRAVQEVDPDAHFRTLGRPVNTAIEYGDTILVAMAQTGRPVPDALACYLAGLTAAEAADPDLDMDAVRALAALRRAGGDL